jgi:hypothetical protein
MPLLNLRSMSVCMGLCKVCMIKDTFLGKSLGGEVAVYLKLRAPEIRAKHKTMVRNT